MGSTEADVRAAYGAAVLTRPGWPGSYPKYLTIDGPDNHTIEFDIGDSSGTVDSIQVATTFAGINDGSCGD